VRKKRTLYENRWQEVEERGIDERERVEKHGEKLRKKEGH
jgi:hypothetical protein